MRRVLRIRTRMKGRIGALREPSVFAEVRVDRPIGLRWPLDVLCQACVAREMKGRTTGSASGTVD